MKRTVLPEGKLAEVRQAVDEAADRHTGARGSLIPILQEVQDRVGYLPPEAMERIAEMTGVSAARIFGVASFYSQFRLTPVGRYVIKVCHGTACHVQGASAITEAICDELKVPDGGTTADGKFTVASVACLGCCSLAPVIMIEENTFGRLTPDEARKIVREYGGPAAGGASAEAGE
jgi:NADH-quinone oxidoreductase subunit E